MEAEERPIKRRRLSSEDGTPGIIKTTTSQIEDPVIDSTVDDYEHPAPDQKHNQDELNGGSELLEESTIGLPAPDEVSPLAATINPHGEPMSKNQQKKLRKQLEWEAKRDERKVVRKIKTLAKRERKREQRKQLRENGDELPLPQPQHSMKPKFVQLPITFLIDCGFDNLMRDSERKSLATQITRSYSDNRHSTFHAHLAICSFTGHLRERFDNVLSHYTGWKGVRFLDCDFVEAAAKAKEWMLQPQKGGQLAGWFSSLQTEDQESIELLKEQGEVVYLTSEAEDTLTELKPYSTYIIGGLVDKNREKGICYKRATKRGVKTARLPIGEFMDMQSRKVLATNHVNEIMLKWLESGNWGEAFMTAIPKRKGGMLKGADGEDEDQQDGNVGSEGNDMGGSGTHPDDTS